MTSSSQKEDLCNIDKRLTTMDNDLFTAQSKPITNDSKQVKSNVNESIKEEHINKNKLIEEQPVIRSFNVTKKYM